LGHNDRNIPKMYSRGKKKHHVIVNIELTWRTWLFISEIQTIALSTHESNQELCYGQKMC